MDQLTLFGEKIKEPGSTVVKPEVEEDTSKQISNPPETTENRSESSARFIIMPVQERNGVDFDRQFLSLERSLELRGPDKKDSFGGYWGSGASYLFWEIDRALEQWKKDVEKHGLTGRETVKILWKGNSREIYEKAKEEGIRYPAYNPFNFTREQVLNSVSIGDAYHFKMGGDEWDYFAYKIMALKDLGYGEEESKILLNARISIRLEEWVSSHKNANKTWHQKFERDCGLIADECRGTGKTFTGLVKKEIERAGWYLEQIEKDYRELCYRCRFLNRFVPPPWKEIDLIKDKIKKALNMIERY